MLERKTKIPGRSVEPTALIPGLPSTDDGKIKEIHRTKDTLWGSVGPTALVSGFTATDAGKMRDIQGEKDTWKICEADCSCF